MKFMLCLLFTILLCGICSARFVTAEIKNEIVFSDDLVHTEEVELFQWLKNSRAMRQNEFQCLLAALLTVYTEFQYQRAWVIGVLERIRFLDEIMANCENLIFETLREQCRQATEALQAANMALITLELRLRMDELSIFREELVDDFRRCTAVVDQILNETLTKATKH